MSKPTTLPEFAKLDQVDPVSLQPNVEVPPDVLKDYGWIFKQKPPRQYFNWLHRLTYEWLKWFDDDNSGSAPVTLGGVTNVITGTLYWKLCGAYLLVRIPKLIYGYPIPGVTQVWIKDIPEEIRWTGADAKYTFSSNFVVQDLTTITWANISPQRFSGTWKSDEWEVKKEGKSSNWIIGQIRHIFPVTLILDLKNSDA